MNLQEFAKLAVGDQVRIAANNSAGTVTKTSDAGVHVAWGSEAAMPFFYSVNSTAWFQWELAERK